jgi:hypothetical protein
LVDTLFESILEDMDREGFQVSDKYKSKYEELGKIINQKLRAILFFSSFPSFSFSILELATIFIPINTFFRKFSLKLTSKQVVCMCE